MYYIRVLWACAKKDLMTSLSERIFLLTLVLIPLQYLCLFVLYVLPGDRGPTAVVMDDHGLYAQKFYDVMDQSQSFHLFHAQKQEAQKELAGGRIVAIVTIPENFDRRVIQHQPVQVSVQINNLNTDFTADIRRAIPLSIATFYAQVFPHMITITAQEDDWYSQDTSYIPYLGISIVVLAIALAGVIQAGTSWSREWELRTMPELFLSPAPRWCLIIGKMLAAFGLALIASCLVLPVLIGVLGARLAHLGEMLGYMLLILVIFSALGTILGVLVRQRRLITTLALASVLPLFFISGPLGPVSFDTWGVQAVASFFPLTYALAGMQHAFNNFDTNTLGWGNAIVLAGYALLFLLGAIVMLRRTVVHQ